MGADVLRKVSDLTKWLHKKGFEKESRSSIILLKIASLDKDKLFSRYQKLESMVLSALKSPDEHIRNEAKVASSRSEDMRRKFEAETSLSFEMEYLKWKTGGPVDSYIESPNEAYDPKHETLEEVYHWRNYHNEMDDILRDLGYSFTRPGVVNESIPTPGQRDQRIDHIVRDVIGGKLSADKANNLLGEDNSEWLNELVREQMIDDVMSGEYAASQREASRGHTLSPAEEVELDDAMFDSDWRNHIEAEGVWILLDSLDWKAGGSEAAAEALTKGEQDGLVRIQKDSYSDAIMVKRDDLYAPDSKPGEYFYGVTKIEYAKEYMEKQLDGVLRPDKYSSFNDEMSDLVDETGNLFFRFQNHEDEEGLGNNVLVDHLREWLNDQVAIDASSIGSFAKVIWAKVMGHREGRRPLSEEITLPENWLDYYGGLAGDTTRTPKALIISRYLDDVEREAAGRSFHPSYRAVLRSGYPHLYKSKELGGIRNKLLSFSKTLNGKLRRDAKEELLSLTESLKKDYPEAFDLEELRGL